MGRNGISESMQPRIVSTLRRLGREKRTGVFRTTADTIRREVMLEQGAIIGALSTAVDERLGEIMVRRGCITERQLHNASKLMRAGTRRLGDALVDLRIVARGEVNVFVRTQLAEIGSKFLTEPVRRLEFFHEATLDRVTENPVPIADVIIEAARRGRHGMKADIESLLDSNFRPALTGESMSAVQTLRLETHEAFVLSRCDGRSNIHDIFAQSPLSAEDTARILLGFEQAGIIAMMGVVAEGH